MADYYSHNDPRRKGSDPYLDYDTGSGAKWIWAAIALVAVIALLTLGSTGGGIPADGTAPALQSQADAVPAAPAADDPALAAPATE